MSSSSPGAASRADVYSRITAEIVAVIERGAGPYRAPWFHNGTDIARPTNLASGRRYRGINTLALWVAGLAAGYSEGLWGTYRQWQAAGAQVRKGERATTVVLWRQIEARQQGDDGADDDDDRRRMFARAFSVFNVAQVDGYERPATPTLPEDERLANAEAFIANLGVKTVFGGAASGAATISHRRKAGQARISTRYSRARCGTGNVAKHGGAGFRCRSNHPLSRRDFVRRRRVFAARGRPVHPC